MYQTEIVWNREFRFVPHGGAFTTLAEAVKFGETMKNSGDGARVKEARVVDIDGRVVYANGKKVSKEV